MPYFYKYLGDDQDLVVESEDPRPDLLEWAYWTEIDAPAPKFNEGGIVQPAPVVAVNDSPTPQAIVEPTPVVEPAPVQVTEDVAPQPEQTPAPADEIKPTPAKKAPAKKAPAKAPAKKDAE